MVLSRTDVRVYMSASTDVSRGLGSRGPGYICGLDTGIQRGGYGFVLPFDTPRLCLLYTCCHRAPL